MNYYYNLYLLFEYNMATPKVATDRHIKLHDDICVDEFYFESYLQPMNIMTLDKIVVHALLDGG
jgi:hypothetical protein